jgi:hypothetical protein
MSAINPIIHGKDGINRFRDYVSSMPEFLQNESDVVELLRFFSDYINNAYRSIDVATQFRFKLVSTESNIGINYSKLNKLKTLFEIAEAKESSVIYLANEASDRVKFYFNDTQNGVDSPSDLFTGTLISQLGSDVFDTISKHYFSTDSIGKTISLNGVLYTLVDIVDDTHIKLNFNATSSTTYNYLVDVPINDFVVIGTSMYTNKGTSLVLNTVGVTKSIVDTYQDPFTRSISEKILTEFGEVPAMLEFSVSNISDVRSRRLKSDVGISDKYEVYFDVNIFNVNLVPSVESVTSQNSSNYIVDYYKYLPLYNENSYVNKYYLHFSDNDKSLSINDNGLGFGFFYVRDITKTDSILGTLNSKGINNYVDPTLYEKFDAEYPNNWKSGVTFKKGEYTRYQGTRYVVNSDHISTLVEMPGSSDLYSEVIDLWYSKDYKSNSKVNDTLTISYSDSEFLFDYKSFNVGDIIYRYELGDISTNNKGTIRDITNDELVVENIIGDLISNGEFVVIDDCDQVIKKAKFNNSTTIWDRNKSDSYRIGEYVLYNNLRYIVTSSHVASEFDTVTNPSNSAFYTLSMNNLLYRESLIDYNPYIWGGYKGIYANFGEDINLNYSYDKLSEILYIQQVEELSLHIKHDQRRWLFNPTFASQSELNRNGFMSITSNNKIATNIEMTNGGLVESKNVTVTSPSHGFLVGDKINLISDSSNFDGSYTILSTSVDTFTFDLENDSLFNNDNGICTYSYDIVSSAYLNKITTGDVIYARQNLVESNEVNPEVSPNGTYYKYVINGEIESQYTSKYDTRTFTPTKTDNDIAIDYISEYDGILYNDMHEVELNSDLACNIYFDNASSLYICSDTIIQIASIQGDGNSTTNTITVITTNSHNLSVGDIINIKVNSYSEYGVEINSVVDSVTFTYSTIENTLSEVLYTGFISLGDDNHGLNNGDVINLYSSSSDFDTDSINVSIYDSSTIKYNSTYVTSNTIDTGFFRISTTLLDGNIVKLVNRTSSYENSIYRVKRNAAWEKLDKKLYIKSRNLFIDAEVVENYDPDFDDSAIEMNTFSNAFVNNAISNSDRVYKVEVGDINSFKYDRPVIEGIDTTKPSFQEYNYKFDTNTIAPRDDMDDSFKGIPDMGTSIVEKIERLAYQKDPSVIDYELIGYLGKYLGYDITNLSSDISESAIYNTDKERENAVRMVIRSLPQFYTLKNTESGLEMIMLMFGIVGEVINMWTDNSDPYREFIPDYSVDTHRYSKMLNDENVSLVPTPHFNYRINITGNYANELSPQDIKRLNTRIEKYKPINTVFNGLVAYVDQTINSSISISSPLNKGRMVVDIGYDLDFVENTDNSCF